MKNNVKKAEKSNVSSSSALNKEFVRDYKSISISPSTNFNRIDSKFDSMGSTIEVPEHSSPTDEKSKSKIKRNSSLISLKSINQNLKAMLKIKSNDNHVVGDAETGIVSNDHVNKKKPQLNPSLMATPCLRIDHVDMDETRMLLHNYPQSPQRYPSTSSVSATPAVTPMSSSTTPLLQYQEYQPRSESTSPYLSIAVTPVRRSSTSDILSNSKDKPAPSPAEPSSKKSSQLLHSRSGSGSGSALAVDPNVLSIANKDRRPSTSELLRKNRERKGSEGNKIGRSISSGGGLSSRSANRNRRLSMAY